MSSSTVYKHAHYFYLNTIFCRENFCQVHFVVDNVACCRRETRKVTEVVVQVQRRQPAVFVIYINTYLYKYKMLYTYVCIYHQAYCRSFSPALQRNNFYTQAGTNASHLSPPQRLSALKCTYSVNLVAKHRRTHSLTLQYRPFYCYWSWLNFLLNLTRLSNKHRAAFRNKNDNHKYFFAFVAVVCAQQPLEIEIHTQTARCTHSRGVVKREQISRARSSRLHMLSNRLKNVRRCSKSMKKLVLQTLAFCFYIFFLLNLSSFLLFAWRLTIFSCAIFICVSFYCLNSFQMRTKV